MCNSQSNDLMKRQMMKTSCISNVPGQDFKSCSKDLQMARFVMSLQ